MNRHTGSKSAPATASHAGGASAAFAPALVARINGLASRIKNVVLSPKTEWGVIASEPGTVAALYAGYVTPLALPAALLGSLRMSVLGINPAFGDGLRIPILLFVSALFGVFILGLIIDVLAPTFSGRRDLHQAFKVAAYSLTPAGLSSVLTLAPPILAMPLQLLAGLYGVYVLYLGLPVLMRSRREKAFGYAASVVICSILVGVVFAVLPSCAKAPTAAPPVIEPISACESLVLKAADLSGFLQAPITHATALAGDGQSCAFLTTGFSAITVSVRPGLGKASLEAWSTGKMPLPARPLDNVGDDGRVAGHAP